MFELPFDSITDALLVLAILVLLVRGKRIVNYVFDAVADRLLKSINGGLGLNEIRKSITALGEDVTAMKKQVGDVAEMRIQIENLEGQIEAKLTE